MKAKVDYERLPDVVGSFIGVGIPGLTAKLVKRTDKKAMYYRWDHVWEVFRIEITEAGEVFGRAYPKRESYPSNEHFGSTAWCFSSEKNAERMYNSI